VDKFASNKQVDRKIFANYLDRVKLTMGLQKKSLEEVLNDLKVRAELNTKQASRIEKYLIKVATVVTNTLDDEARCTASTYADHYYSKDRAAWEDIIHQAHLHDGPYLKIVLAVSQIEGDHSDTFWNIVEEISKRK